MKMGAAQKDAWEDVRKVKSRPHSCQFAESMHLLFGNSRKPAELYYRMDFLMHCIPLCLLVSRKALL